MGKNLRIAYSLRPKTIALIPDIFCPKMIVLLPKSFNPKMNVKFLCDLLNDIKQTFDTGIDLRGSKSNMLQIQSHHQEDFRHRNFWGCFRVVDVFYYERHTYNYSLNGEGAKILPILENKTNFLGWRE